MEMILPRQIPTLFTIILILLLQVSLDAKHTRICPLGFQLAYTKSNEIPICYRLKGPEKFTDTFSNCSGNLYTSKLYDDLNLENRTELTLWTEYRSAYAGGPFVDVSFTNTAGSLLKTSFQVTNMHLGIEEELCVAKEPVSNYTAERCDKEYYRYCFVEPYPEHDLPKCEDLLEGGVKFWSPTPMCLVAVPGTHSTGVRATWPRAEEVCELRGADILYNGWRYSNHPELQIRHTNIFPLRVTMIAGHNLTFPSADDVQWYCGEWVPVNLRRDELETHPCTYAVKHERKYFYDTVKAPLAVTETSSPGLYTGLEEKSYGILNNSVWETVNGSYLFHELICEKELELEKVTLVVQTKPFAPDQIILKPSKKIDVSDILCYTDSVTFHPTPVEVIYSNSTETYVLEPIKDGYYWCVHNDSKRFLVSHSNKYLWTRVKDSLKSRYAIKISLKHKYTMENVEEAMMTWEKELRDFVYYYTMYKINHTKDEPHEIEAYKEIKATKSYKKEHMTKDSTKEGILFDIILKELYLDGKTALVHVQLGPMMKSLPQGRWDNITVLKMNPVYYCSIDDRLLVQNRKLKINCTMNSCVGDFNKGLQIIVETTDDPTCKPTTPPGLFRGGVSDSMPEAPLRSTSTTPTSGGMGKTDEDSSEETSESTTLNVTAEPFTTPRQPTTPPVTIDTIATTSPDIPSTMTLPTFTTPSTTTTTTTTTPLPPVEEQLEQVMDNLEQLLENDNTVSIDHISEPFQRVDQLLAEDDHLEIPSRLLQLLDRIGTNLELNGTESAKQVHQNVALVAVNADPSMPVNGLRIATRENDTFTNDAFEIIRDDIDCNHLSTTTSEAVVRLPNSVANSTRRVSFVVFRNDRAFQTNSTNETVNSRVLSINIQDIEQFPTGEVINIYFRPVVGEPTRNQTRTCAYWKFHNDTQGGVSTGSWSTEGCQFIPASAPGKLDTCQCNHLTHFAEILVSRTVFSDLDEKILEILSVIGCCLSIFGLTMIGITGVLFRSWRRDFNNKVWLQLCIAIFLLVICFLVTVFVQFKTYNLGCMMLGIILHYSVLASFCWMLVAAVLSYRRLVMVFSRDATHKLLRASAFGWGFPIAVVGILLASSPDSYKKQFEDISAASSFCYPSGLGLWLAVYAPIAVMLLANWTLFVLILRSVFGPRGIDRHGSDTNEALRCASVSCLLVFLFGLPWVFGLFAQNVVAAYFFAMTATFQGFVLFIFFVVGNKKTRDLWLNKLKIKQTLKVPVTSSTYTNRSTGPAPGWRGGAPGSVEARLSKPRSLTNSDNGRFS